jgi:hypothetical protein
MPKRRNKGHLSRRQFLGRSVQIAGIAGFAAVAQRAMASGATAVRSVNPFAYDVSRLSQTPPELIHYREVGRISDLREDARKLVVGPEDRLYLGAGNYISVFDREGSIMAEMATSGPVRCLFATNDGDLFVGQRNQIEVFDSKGQRRAAWDKLDSRSWVAGITVSDNAVFAADAGNRIILRYDRSGKLVSRIGARNRERNIPGFTVPSPFFDVELHRDGLLRVNNPGRHRVEAYTMEGEFVLGWGRASAAIDGFCGCCNPINIALMPDGRFVTCEKGLPRVKVYGLDGTFESVVAGTESFPENARVAAGESRADPLRAGLDVAVDSGGDVYILDNVRADIRIMRKKPEGIRTEGSAG